MFFTDQALPAIVRRHDWSRLNEQAKWAAVTNRVSYASLLRKH